jgi:hypothetical protein
VSGAVHPEKSIVLKQLTFLSARWSFIKMNFAYFWLIAAAIRSAMKSRRALALGNLALRQQIVILKRSVRRPRPTAIDRLFWIAFAQTVNGWRDMICALSPDTVVRWHREGFRRYWIWKSVHWTAPNWP